MPYPSNIKRGKAPGENGIVTDLAKVAGKNSKQDTVLYAVYLGIVIQLHKKRDKTWQLLPFVTTIEYIKTIHETLKMKISHINRHVLAVIAQQQAIHKQ